jgi:hypothetical protein
MSQSSRPLRRVVLTWTLRTLTRWLFRVRVRGNLAQFDNERTLLPTMNPFSTVC